jgi:hypothetical protein
MSPYMLIIIQCMFLFFDQTFIASKSCNHIVTLIYFSLQVSNFVVIAIVRYSQQSYLLILLINAAAHIIQLFFVGSLKWIHYQLVLDHIMLLIENMRIQISRLLSLTLVGCYCDDLRIISLRVTLQMSGLFFFSQRSFT